MSSDINKRVGAIIEVTDKKVRFLGYGTYTGEDILGSDDIDICGDFISEFDDGIAVGKIELDSGKIMYECEAHIYDIVTIQTMLNDYITSGYDIINVDIDDLRKEKN